MKTLVSLLSWALIPNTVWANALASIYNGEQFQLQGWTLVQDASVGTDFYVMPQSLRIARKVVTDPSDGSSKAVPDVRHSVRTINGEAYSVYALRLSLATPSDHALIMARAQLKRLVGPSARIRGMAPICGVDVGAPLTATSTESEPQKDAILVRYAVRSTEDGRCNSIVTNGSINVTVTAPLRMEPGLARDLTSTTGLLIPNLNFILPYKYKDRVVVRVNAHSVYEQLKQSSGFSGTYRAVMANVSDNLTKAFSQLSVTGQLHVDSENPDPTIRNSFLELAKDVLARTLMRYTSIPAKGADPTPLMVGIQGASSPQSLRADLAMDEASVKSQENFVVDFSNATYSSVRTQVQVNLSRVPEDILSREVREKMETSL